MRMLDAMHISSSGMSAQRTRVNVAASNLANAQSTRTAEGGPYQRQDPVFESIDTQDGGGVKVAGIVKDESAGQRVFLPDHPDADAEGFVQLPNVDPIAEVVNLMSARRGFEANASAFETAKALIQRAMDITR